MRILITGSSGMIGSALAPALVEHDVIGVDKKKPQFSKTKTHLHDLMSPLDVNPAPDVIIHLAANARVWELVENPALALENVVTTHNVFEYARQNGVKKIIYASSREVYGNGNRLPIAEDIGSQRSSESPYSVGKIFGEGYAWAYKRCYGIDTKIVRFSNVYGKYDFSDRFIPKVIKQLRANEPVEIWGKDKKLDFTYLDDAVMGVIHLLDNWSKETEYNIAYGKGHTLLSVAEKLKEALNSKSEIIIKDTHVGEVMTYEADISLMESLGWQPTISIDEGLNKALDYYK